jgi:hypothetical protein
MMRLCLGFLFTLLTWLQGLILQSLARECVKLRQSPRCGPIRAIQAETPQGRQDARTRWRAIERQRASGVDGDATSVETIPILMVESVLT